MNNIFADKKNQKRATFVFAVFVIILLIFFFVARNRAKEAAEFKQAQVDQTVVRAQQECLQKQNPEVCSDGVRQELAQESGNPDYCSSLSNDEADVCLNLAALTAQDADICEGIVDAQLQTSCEQAVTSQTPYDERSYELCELFDGSLVEDCQFQWTLEHIIDGDCSATHITDELCLIGRQILDAQKAQDPDLCDVILDLHYVFTCRNLTEPGDRDFDGLGEWREQELGTSDTSTDSDEDGLSDADELDYETDPADADSDDDGYTDGTEVRAGYNPNGPGSL